MAESDNSVQYVARFAMQTAKSKNFQELAENLFSNQTEKEEVLKFLKKEGLLKRSLPDVMAEGSQIAIKERTQVTTLDFSQIGSMKFVFNGKTIPFNGKENFAGVYHAFKKLHGKKRADSWFPFFMSEAHAELPILAVVTLSAYAKASIIAHMEEITAAATATSDTSSQKTAPNRTRASFIKSLGVKSRGAQK